DTPRLDARGMVVMPGGVDIHAHVAGSSVNHARRLLPEEHVADPAPGDAIRRSGTGGTLPSTFVTGYRYAGLGYTTAMEAAMAPPTRSRCRTPCTSTATTWANGETPASRSRACRRWEVSGRISHTCSSIATAVRGGRNGSPGRAR